MRDYLVITVVLASLPIGLFRPFYGLLVYLWISYMYPHELAWSFAQSFPVAKLSALSVMGGLLFSPTGKLSTIFQKENLAMLLLWGTFTVSSVFAYYPDSAWYHWQDTSKLIVMSLVASMMLENAVRIRQFLLVIAFSLGFFGFKGGLFGIATGGTQMVLGPGDSIIGANNNIGLALNMCLPLLWYLAREERGPVRWALKATFFLTIPAILFTYSRASAITVAVLLLVMMLKSRRRLLVLAAVFIGGLLAAPFAPQKWLDRQSSTLSYEEDSSAMSRLDNWKFCWKVAMDRPFTGAGFNFQSAETFAKYEPEFLIKYGGKVWDTHNIIFGILTSHGFPGLIAFVSMILFCLINCSRLKGIARRHPDMRWIGTYAEMIQLSFFALLVNGMFVNMEYYDLPYHWVAVVASLKVLADKYVARPENDDVYASDMEFPVAATT